MLKLIRFNVWWNAVVPQVMGWVYFGLIIEGSIQSGSRDFRQVILFFTALIGVSAFGYLLNDFCDIESDRLAGKNNMLTNYSIAIRILFVLAPLVLSGVAWLFLMDVHTFAATLLLLLQVVALVVYSVPPIRLKHRGVAGVLADAFYGHVNPVFITLAVFGGWLLLLNGSWIEIFLLVLIFFVTAIKGVRNILLHQLEDRKKDKKAGVKTFVNVYGPLATINIINQLLPVEAILLLAYMGLLVFLLPPFIIPVILFSALSYLKFSGWKLAYLPKRQLKFKFLYFLNDYYECWIPAMFALLFAKAFPQYFYVTILHFIVFPGFILKLVNDAKTIRENFKTKEDY